MEKISITEVDWKSIYSSMPAATPSGKGIMSAIQASYTQGIQLPNNPSDDYYLVAKASQGSSLDLEINAITGQNSTTAYLNCYFATNDFRTFVWYGINRNINVELYKDNEGGIYVRRKSSAAVHVTLRYSSIQITLTNTLYIGDTSVLTLIE